MVFIANFASTTKPTALQIRGTMQFPDGERPPVVTCDVHPPSFKAVGLRDFELDMNDARMPTLVFSANGYDPQVVYLDKLPHPVNGEIKLPEPVVFRKSPPYQPPAQVAGGNP